MSALLLGLLSAALAQESTDEGSGDSRDDDIFGGGAEAPAPPPEEPPPAEAPADAGPATRDDAMLSTATTSDATIAERIGVADDALTVGGKLTLRTVLSMPESPKLGDLGLDSPNLLDLYLDARPDDRTRAYVSARLTHDWSVTDGSVNDYGVEQSTSSISLDQLWLKFDVGRVVYVTAGRQRIKWGTGRFWNPTDFMNQQARDPLAAFDVRTGVSLLKVHVPVTSSANLYAIANLDGADAVEDVGGALRGELAFGQGEASLSAAFRKDQPQRYGADLSYGIWLFDVRVEGAALHGIKEPFYKGTLDMETFTFPEEYSREDDWITQGTVGAEISLDITDEDTISLGGEYFVNHAGYTDPGIYAWLLLNGQYTPFYLGRQYAGAYLYYPSPGPLDDTAFTVSALSNLSDQTGVLRLDHRWNALTWLDLTTYAAYYFGDQGEFYYALSVPAIPGVDGLEDGLEIVPSRWNVGVWAQVRF